MSKHDPRYFKVYQDGDDRELEKQVIDIINSGAAPGIDTQARAEIEEIQRAIENGEIGGGGSGVDQKAREDIQNVTEQLADTQKQQRSLTESNTQEKKLYVNLQDDDGRIEVMTKLKPILDELNVKTTFAINPGLVGQTGYMTWAQIKQLKSEGHEILNHTMGTYGTIEDITLDQLKTYYEQEKNLFKANGIETYDYLVYSGTMPWRNADVRNKISQVYKCCFANTDAPKNYLPFDNYAIHRAALTYNPTQTIDEYLAMGSGFLVLFQHAWMNNNTDFQTIRNAITYLKSKNVTFVTAKEMVDKFSNVLNLGNVGQDKFLVDKNGNVDFTVDGKGIREFAPNVFFETTNFSGKPLTEYKPNSITIEKVGGTYANWGLPSSGTIRTYRLNDDRFSYQEYTQLGKPDIWKRFWDNDKQEWKNLGYFGALGAISVSTAQRPKFNFGGVMFHDRSINKQMWAQADSFNVPYVQVARNTAYTKDTFVNNSTDSSATNNRLYQCIVAGTTAETRPEYPTTLGATITDGTAQFKYIGDRVVYRDATGTVIS